LLALSSDAHRIMLMYMAPAVLWDEHVRLLLAHVHFATLWGKHRTTGINTVSFKNTATQVESLKDSLLKFLFSKKIK
jgi:hypothetical protein